MVGDADVDIEVDMTNEMSMVDEVDTADNKTNIRPGLISIKIEISMTMVPTTTNITTITVMDTQNQVHLWF